MHDSICIEYLKYQIYRSREYNDGCQHLGGENMQSCSSAGIEFQLFKLSKFWRLVVEQNTNS